MSDAVAPVRQAGMRQRVAGRWQIPLLLGACALFGWALWRLRPAPQEVPFDQRLDLIIALGRSGLYPEVSDEAQRLLSDSECTDAQKRRLHRVLGDLIYDNEIRKLVKDELNAEHVIQHYRESVADASELDAPTLLRIAEAWEWMDRPWEAIRYYEQALDRGAPGAVRVQRRVLELRLALGGMEPDAIAKEVEAFAKQAESSPEDLMWAVHRRVELFVEQQKLSEAEAFLETYRARVQDTPQQPRLEYLLAWVLYHEGRHDEAERLLRALRGRLTSRDDVDAASGWLLGRIVQMHGAPEEALSLYDGVLRAHFEGMYVAASRLGRAECLVSLDRHEEALAAYGDAIAMLAKVPPTRLFDQDLVLESARDRWYEMLRENRPYRALDYLRVAIRLLPPDDPKAEGLYRERLADLLTSLAERELAAAEHAEPPSAATTQPNTTSAPATSLRQAARARLIEAGQTYLRLSRLRIDQEEDSARAVWDAADRFDLAGERERSIEVLKEFVAERPRSARLPSALLRLGQSYQALRRYPEAVEMYQRNISLYPRTPQATQSYVPLAACYMEMGPSYAEHAERTLLSVLVEAPDAEAVITPEAEEFRLALLKIAELYMSEREYEKAIVRLEEAATRYPDDPQITRIRFQLAEACRRSAAQIPQSLNEATNAARRDSLIETYRQRLARARTLYEQVIAALQDVPAERLSTLEAAYLRVSYLYRADCAFDAQAFTDRPSPEGYEEALRLYDAAAWKYNDEPIALAAYVQMIHCYLRMGQAARARTTLERAKWILRGMPDRPDVWPLPGENKETWNEYLTWLGQTPTLAQPGT